MRPERKLLLRPASVRRSSEAVRNTLLFGFFLGLAACGDATSHAQKPPVAADGMGAAPRIARPSEEAPATPAAKDATVTSAPAPVALAASVGSLERPAALRHFFDALAKLEQGQASDDVHIVQFGDSHTAADYETGPVRRALQSRFGDGGRGFLAMGRPYKAYVGEGFRAGMSREWSWEHGKYERGKFTGDGMYGLGGLAIATSVAGGRAWTELTARFSRVELSFLQQPRGGSIDLYVDGGHLARVTTRGKDVGSAYRSFDVQDGPHNLEVRAVGDGEVRLFGMTLDRALVGVTVDSIGINGARVANLLNYSEAHWAAELKHRSPDLVVLAFGTNEAGDETSQETYEKGLVDVLGRIARAVPSASCLLLGPPDRATRTQGVWATPPKLQEIIASQQRVAEAAGCAFYNQLEAMGGPGTINTWVDDPRALATKDRVHLTRDGYAYLAHQLVGDLLRAYAAWRADKGLPPSRTTASLPHLAPSPPPASTAIGAKVWF
jgi:lysophospholipase L1-like esterase